MAAFEPPTLSKTRFNCPHCGAFAAHSWFCAHARGIVGAPFPVEEFASIGQVGSGFPDHSEPQIIFKKSSIGISPQAPMLQRVWLSRCISCEAVAIWNGLDLLYPSTTMGDQPNADLPQDIQADYREASAIASRSPRGAAALLRLCLQKLLIALEVPGKTIDQQIGHLVKNGLNPLIQQMLDSVRVIGNESVHPGEMNMEDDVETASLLFQLVNRIAHDLISHPKQVQALYQNLPQAKRDAITKRDGAKE